MSWAWMAPLVVLVVGGGVAATVASEVRRATAHVRLARVEVPGARRRPRRAGMSRRAGHTPARALVRPGCWGPGRAGWPL